MKKLIFVLMLALPFVGQAKVWNVVDLGADPTGKVKATAIINKAVEDAAKEGGGTIYFPAGEYLTASIELKSNITIEIESGAYLRFTDDFEDYLPMVQVRWEGVTMNSFRPLFYAHDAKNLTIKGRGTVDGQGKKWWDEHGRIVRAIRQNGGKNPELTEMQKAWDAANPGGVKVEPYYAPSIERKFFRPPFVQFFQCSDILIEGIKIINSPFWTINPELCDKLTVHGVTIENPISPNTDGINPSSCSNVHISDCHISVGDDCITIKSGRDFDGRNWGKPCENITITNCTMLAGHGGVVIGSEMSGGVRKVTISNCVFYGTDAGIRLKASRGRGGIVEEIRVDNIIMNDIQRNAFIFDLYYDRSLPQEPVSERTPIFRNIHIANVTGSNIRKVGYIAGLEEMSVSEISFSNINLVAVEGFTASRGENIQFHNVDFAVTQGPSIAMTECRDVVLDNVRSKAPLADQPIVSLDRVQNALIANNFPIAKTPIFAKITDSQVVWGSNYFDNVTTVK